VTVSQIRPTVGTDHDQALLGAVLSGYSDVSGLARIVAASDFAQPRHEVIWNAILAVHKAGLVVDPHTVADQLGNAANRLPGGRVYLADLMGTVGVAMNAPYHASKIREQSLRRQVRDAGARMVQTAEDDLDRTADEWVADLRRMVDGIGTRAQRTPTMAETLERVVDIAQHGEPKSVLSPWKSLDELTGGWYPGQLVTFAARPKVGKSLALMACALDAARRGVHVAFCTLEMNAVEVTQRLIANMASVELTRLRKGHCDERDWKRIGQATADLGRLPLHIQDVRPQTTGDVRAHAFEVSQTAKRAGGELGMVVADYLQIIRADAGSKSRSRQQEIGQITQDLKVLAGQLEVPVLTASQLNRNSMTRERPTLSDLRESGDIEQDSDAVILMHERDIDDGPYKIKTGDIELIVAAQRSGPEGMCVVQKRGHFARLSEEQA
jgi:replicative DNA helicase